jgi:Predicted phosphoesterase
VASHGRLHARRRVFAILLDVPVYGVAGNCDWPTPNSRYERIIEAEDHRIFITHGHNYGVRYTQEFIMEAAESQNADIAVYGHTHIVEYLMGPPIILNPAVPRVRATILAVRLWLWSWKGAPTRESLSSA